MHFKKFLEIDTFILENPDEFVVIFVICQNECISTLRLLCSATEKKFSFTAKQTHRIYLLNLSAENIQRNKSISVAKPEKIEHCSCHCSSEPPSSNSYENKIWFVFMFVCFTLCYVSVGDSVSSGWGGDTQQFNLFVQEKTHKISCICSTPHVSIQ